MKAKNYLQKLQSLDLHINAKIEQKEHYMDLACRATSRLSAVNYGGTSHRSKVEDNVCKMIDIEREIDREIDRLVNLRRKVLQILENLEDERFRQILEYRYLNYWSWEKMAGELNYDLSWLHRLHKKALDAFEEELKKEEEAGGKVMVG